MTTMTATCSLCRGAGVVEERHPHWGRINCPDPTIEIVCPRCGGSATAIVVTFQPDISGAVTVGVDGVEVGTITPPLLTGSLWRFVTTDGHTWPGGWADSESAAIALARYFGED